MMEPTDWPQAHSDALREFLAKGMSFSAIAKAINAKFKTAYTRNATIGRARRIKLVGLDRPESLPRGRLSVSTLCEFRSGEFRPLEFPSATPVFEKVKPVKLRCVEVEPRHLSLTELEWADCRYPYGGDEEGEAITFCGQPKRPGSSYCTPHFHLSRNPRVPSGRSGGAVSLRVVEAA